MTRSRFVTKPRSGDPRYHTAKWKRLAREVIVAPGHFLCYREGCYNPATCADHIDPVGPYTTDAEFFDRSRLRPACRKCNISRGFAAAIGAVETDGPLPAKAMGRRDSIFGHSRPRVM
jgi:hypothetical protein